jgi:hypothetical protein
MDFVIASAVFLRFLAKTGRRGKSEVKQHKLKNQRLLQGS